MLVLARDAFDSSTDKQLRYSDKEIFVDFNFLIQNEAQRAYAESENKWNPTLKRLTDFARVTRGTLTETLIGYGSCTSRVDVFPPWRLADEV